MPPERTIGEGPGQQPGQELRRACDELRKRLRAGESCRAEDFFDSYPSLSSNPDHARELIWTELSLRRERGEALQPHSWYGRFPRWREQLQSWFRDQGLLSDSVPPDPATVEQTSLTGNQVRTVAKPPGRAFGRYRLLEELGRGGMGVVYQAKDTLLGRIVAVKMIGAGHLAQAESVERFYREARAVAQLNHPHIVPLYEIGEHEGQHYFTMAYAAGGSLAQHKQRVGADARTTAAMIEQVARAVHFAHTKGILHRDLKPGNVMIGERGEPLVSDFGLAKFVDADADLTHEGVLVGTPAYMAPELAEGKPSAASARSDVWSIGVMLYELATGKRPFGGTGAKEVAMNVTLTEPPWPRALNPKLDRALDTIILKCLEREPARRYATAEELADDLARWQRGEAITARPEGWPRRGWRALRRNALISVLGLFVAVAAVAIPVGRNLLDPDRPLHGIEHKLARGEAVDLIGRTGGPAWSRFPLRAGAMDGKLRPDGLFSLGSAEFCLLELVTDPQKDEFRFSAEVLHENGAAAEVGIYFAYASVDTNEGSDPLLCMLTFNDLGLVDAPAPKVLPTKSHVALFARRCHKIDLGEISPALCGELIDPKKKWRKLQVEVRPTHVQCFWDATQLAPVSRKKLLGTFGAFLKARPGNHAIFPPRGGLGLYVSNGTASFRNVRVEPLN